MSYAPPPPPPAPYVQPGPPYGPPLPAVPSSGKRPWWKTTWMLIASGVVVGLLIGAASTSGANSKVKTKTVAGPTTTATAAGPTTTATVTTTPTKVIATHVRTVRVTYTPPVKVAFSDGTFRVGSEIKAGTYHTKPGPDGCYWERDARGDSISSIIANDNITGPTTIDIQPTDFAFKSNGGCDWVRIG